MNSTDVKKWKMLLLNWLFVYPADQLNHSSGVSLDRRLANAFENTITYGNTGTDHGNLFAPASPVF